MARKRISDLIQEENQKPSPTSEESTIDIPATPVGHDTEEIETVEEAIDTAQVHLDATVKELQVALEQTQKQEALYKQQIQDLEATVEDLKANFEKTQEKQSLYPKQITDLKSELAEQKASVKKLTKELADAKQDALKLAEANANLTEELNNLKKPKEAPKAITQYKKSYRALDTRPITLPAEDAPDNSSQMWLLD
jgi:chromosome segregation ATPase